MKTREILVAYLQAKVTEGDWHAVSDAANDLRVLEARVSQEPIALLVEKGIKTRETEIDGRKFIEISRA